VLHIEIQPTVQQASGLKLALPKIIPPKLYGFSIVTSTMGIGSARIALSRLRLTAKAQRTRWEEYEDIRTVSIAFPSKAVAHSCS
jgi:hypothetical protein